MNAIEMEKLTHKFAQNHPLLEEYARLTSRNPDSSCDRACQRGKLCGMATTQINDDSQCNILLEEYDAAN